MLHIHEPFLAWNGGGGKCVENILCGMVIDNETQFGFMLVKAAIDVVFMFSRLQEEYCAKRKSCICAF